MLSRSLFIAVLVSASGGCTTSQTEARCVGNQCGSQSFELKESTNVPDVFVGMTRSDVISIPGDKFYSHSGEGRPPVVDSFPYIENGKTKYIYVEYSGGRVEFANPGFDWPYRVR